jgi:hypothetical protein
MYKVLTKKEKDLLAEKRREQRRNAARSLVAKRTPEQWAAQHERMMEGQRKWRAKVKLMMEKSKELAALADE